ncbi:MAG: phosphoribosylamine--glycine ligase [Fidelibacterota bacterium]|nr:MAG: phosphoribosylamine--glycine ligase [Candidatus Neomarinimicrobiota bacterium]
MAKILVLGSGGREHALIWSLARENRHTLMCAPGNAGTAGQARNVALDLADHGAVAGFIEQESIDLTIVGPEDPLAAGIVDHLEAEGLRVFGPTQAGARLESSKLFARDFMKAMGIPHPDYRSCSSKEEVGAAVRDMGLPIVLKADGLAAGKGVIICRNEADVAAALEKYFDQKAFGDAGLALSVEECLVGTEMSVFAFSDGRRFTVLGTAQDYKRAYDGDQGPNTGGMGSIAPSPLATPELMEEIGDTILQPAISGMAQKGHPYVGVLYAGLMISDGRPAVIEFNVRMGDPESQVVLPLLDTPLSELVEQALAGQLPDKPVIRPGAAVCVVVASEGYPGSYEKGKPITGLEGLDGDMIIYHAGTSLDESGRLVSSGGRVLNVVGTGATIPDAARKVYENIPRIDFPGSFYRKDIGG